MGGEFGPLIRGIKSNDPAFKVLRIDSEFMIHRRNADDDELAELGAAISQNKRMKRLAILSENESENPGLVEVPQEILDGIARNSSILDLRLKRCMNRTLRPSSLFNVMRVFRDKGSLTKLSLQLCFLRTEGVGLLVSVIESCKLLDHISLKHCDLHDANIGGIADACRDHDGLKVLELSWNDIGMDGCKALASLLQQPNCNIATLCLEGNNRIDDYCVASIADSLAVNKTLTDLYLESCERITRRGWFHLCRAMCDTTTVNATHSSNHTLRCVGNISRARPTELLELLSINLSSMVDGRSLVDGIDGDKRQAAMEKILIHHRRLDMEPFFELDLKLLPVIVDWFDYAEDCTMFGEDLRARKLDAIFQFTRSMPMKFVKNPMSKRRSLPFTTTWLSLCVAVVSVVLYLVLNKLN